MFGIASMLDRNKGYYTVELSKYVNMAKKSLFLLADWQSLAQQ
jgi:hypothetical protein